MLKEKKLRHGSNFPSNALFSLINTIEYSNMRIYIIIFLNLESLKHKRANATLINQST